MAATWATSSVRSSAASLKRAGYVSDSFGFRSHSQAGRKRACPPKGYTYPVILKQQHERENIVAFASICGPSNPLPASRHCERDSSAAACSGILFSLLKGCVLLEHVSLNFASPGLLILDLALHKRKRFASSLAHQSGKLVFSLLKGCVRLPTRDTGSICNDFQHLAFIGSIRAKEKV